MIVPTTPTVKATGNTKNTKIYVTGSVGKVLIKRSCANKLTRQPIAETPVRIKKNLSHLLIFVRVTRTRSTDLPPATVPLVKLVSRAF